MLKGRIVLFTALIVIFSVLNSPMEYIPAFEQAVKDVANNISPSDSPFYVGFEGSFGDNMISPRNLNSSHLGKTICVEAIVTRCKIIFESSIFQNLVYRLTCQT